MHDVGGTAGLFHLDCALSDFNPCLANMRCLITMAGYGPDQTDPPDADAAPAATITSGLSIPFKPGITAKAMDEADILVPADRARLAQDDHRLPPCRYPSIPAHLGIFGPGHRLHGRVIRVVSCKSLEGLALVTKSLGPACMDG